MSLGAAIGYPSPASAAGTSPGRRTERERQKTAIRTRFSMNVNYRDFRVSRGPRRGRGRQAGDNVRAARAASMDPRMMRNR